MREIYFEHQVVGRLAKVTAIDAETQIEVSVFGPASASPRDLESLALRKLRSRLAPALSTPAAPGSPGGSRFA